MENDSNLNARKKVTWKDLRGLALLVALLLVVLYFLPPDQPEQLEQTEVVAAPVATSETSDPVPSEGDIQSRPRKELLEELVESIPAMKTVDDFWAVAKLLKDFDTGMGDDPEFIEVEAQAVDVVVALVAAGDYFAMEKLVDDSWLITTRNLLVQQFFLTEKLAATKSDILWGAGFVRGCGCSGKFRLAETRELILTKILQSSERFNSDELEQVRKGLYFHKDHETFAAFLQDYKEKW